MLKKLLLITVLFGVAIILYWRYCYAQTMKLLPVRSIDTMKYSRDLARTKMNDSSFDADIDMQMKQISESGANYVAIGTPYDVEFLPYLKKWVSAARKYNLHVWFRGNLSGWEGWFDYPKISRTQHTTQINQFILKNRDLFEDGDIFTSCPECENGGTQGSVYTDVENYRKFLIKEYKTVKKDFTTIGKNVASNYYSMNGDVAKVIMDKDTTQALDGVVTIDHYVKTPEQLLSDAHDLAVQSGGKIVLGELGAPVPDIHGQMTEQQQAEWIAEVFAKLFKSDDIIGVNYWVNIGGSTALWTDSNHPRLGAQVLKNAYKDTTLYGRVTDINGHPVAGAHVKTLQEDYTTGRDGTFTVPYLMSNQPLQVSATGFKTNANATVTSNLHGDLILVYSNKPVTNFFTKIKDILFSPFSLIKKLLTNHG